MSDRIPLGHKEDQKLEFKSTESLKTPEIVARGVVAMLNAEGGEVWVGLREEHERAVAIEPIPYPEVEARRLLDYLVDAIEPSPLGEEIRVESVQSEAGYIFRITAKPVRKPYAFLRKGGRHFVVRVGARIRPISREELGAAFSGASGVDGEIDTIRVILREQETIQKKAQETGQDLLWLRLKPTTSLDLDLNRVDERELLTDPARTKNRRVGMNFTAAFTPARRVPSRGHDSSGNYIAIGAREHFFLVVYRDGSLRFQAPLSSLWAVGSPDKLLWPAALLEYPISVFRLASALFADSSLWEPPMIPLSTKVVAQLALFGLQGWSLSAGSPAYHSTEVARYDGEYDYIQDKPLVFDLRQILDEPDNCGFRHILRLYEAFGFFREAIPKEFDQKSGRLILPE